MTLGEYYHVGIVVPDVEAAQARLTELLGTQWGPIIETEQLAARTDDGDVVVPNRICYSIEAPHIELILEQPGTTWVCNEHSNLHHIGFFSGALAADSERFSAAGCPLEIMGGHGDGPPDPFAYHRDPLGVRIELVDRAIEAGMAQMLYPPAEG